jgi:hypothetical protein
LAGEGIYRFLLRMPEEHRGRRTDAMVCLAVVKDTIVSRLEQMLERTFPGLGRHG